MNQEIRKIIHVDMDAFFASIEQRDFPEYRSKPLAVGGARERGVVAAASYEARKFGVHSAMPSVTALRLCPGLIIVPPRFDIYKSVSGEIMDILKTFSDLIEPLSLDEAFLDITNNKKGIPSATLIAGAIKTQIREQTGLTASAGVSMNKFLAKLASDMDKPDGLYVITPRQAQEFIDKLKVEKFFGVGKATAEKMHAHNIYTGSDLKQHTREELVRIFGKHGTFFYDISRSIDNRPVNPERIRKSYGKERTFNRDISEPEELYQKIDDIVTPLWNGLQKSSLEGRTLVLKIKYADFVQVTRSRTLDEALTDPGLIASLSKEMLRTEFPLRDSIRLLGVTLTNFGDRDEPGSDGQLTISF